LTRPSPTAGRRRLLTVKEVADRLGVGERFVRRLIFERRITYTKLGRFVRIAEADLDAFIEAGRVEATDDVPPHGEIVSASPRSRRRAD